MSTVLFKILKPILKELTGKRIGKNPIIKSAYNYFLWYFKPEIVEVLGSKMFLDKRDTLRLSVRDIHERETTKIFKDKIKGNMTVLDIGANIGYFTLLASRLVGEKGVVYAFEPEPENFRILKKNVKLNGYSNVVLVRKAVSDISGKIKFYLNEENKASSRIYRHEYGKRRITVESIRLDDFLKKYMKIDFIKMDIEGAEVKALKGMKNILCNNKKLTLVIEFSPSMIKKCGDSPKQFFSMLERYGFKIYNINGKPINSEEIVNIRCSNLLCIKGE